MAERIVLVGGQAVNFWADRYMGRAPELVAYAPYTSKDIDFYGTGSDVKEIAERVHGRCWLNHDEFGPSPQIGVIQFPTPSGDEDRIDVLRLVHGLEPAEVPRLAVPVEEDDDGGVLRFRVMHPVQCLESRTSNVAELPGYDTPQALNQLRASVVCAREFLREILDAGERKAVLKLNERIFRFRCYRPAAAKVLRDHGVDVFDAVLVDERLPEKCLAIRYPQMRQILGL